MRNEQLVVFSPIIALIAVGIILFIPELHILFSGKEKYIPILSDLEFLEKSNIILTIGIVYFAAMEGYSTFMQVVSQDKRNRIEDARNELEKAYGPLYTLLNQYGFHVGEPKELWLEDEQKRSLDKIIATYPFMFSDGIYDFWRERIRNLEAVSVNGRTLEPMSHKIPLEFRNKINEEYERRVAEYSELLKK